MALGHEKLDVYRLAAMLRRLGKRGYSVQEERKVYVLIRDSVSVTYHAWLEFLVSKEIFNH